MMNLGIYTHCKRCGDTFRDPGPTETADYTDGLCSVECLKAENEEEASYQLAGANFGEITCDDEVQIGYRNPDCLDSIEDFAQDE